MKLFAVYHGTRTNDGDSDDLDLYCVADDADEAVLLWRVYFGHPADAPDRIVQFPFDIEGPARSIDWDHMEFPHFKGKVY